jgi:tRNA/rRNA methyltransferase
VLALFDHVEGVLDGLRFYPPDKRPVMVRNMRDILHRMGLSEQDVRTIRGVLRALGGKRGGRG